MAFTGQAVGIALEIAGTDTLIESDLQIGGGIGVENTETGETTLMTTSRKDTARTLLTCGPVVEAKILVPSLLLANQEMSNCPMYVQNLY